ncbi:MAG: response regulator [Fibrobacteria bacterium]|nr:response regulator [Fibrobacteria bacterium]
MLSLVVEDDFTSRLILQRVLQEYGEVHVAANGAEGLEAFKKGRLAGVVYDLVCLDIQLPELSGHDVLAGLRDIEAKDPARRAFCKVMMVTAQDDRENVITAFREQADDYLVKPVETRLLREKLAEFGFQPL